MADVVTSLSVNSYVSWLVSNYLILFLDAKCSNLKVLVLFCHDCLHIDKRLAPDCQCSIFHS